MTISLFRLHGRRRFSADFSRFPLYLPSLCPVTDLRELQNMVGVLKETEATADGTAVELTNQREQLGRITEDAIEIDSMLTRADRLVKVFSKRMMTDKVRPDVSKLKLRAPTYIVTVLECCEACLGLGLGFGRPCSATSVRDLFLYAPS